MEVDDNNIAQQFDEIEVLKSIFDDKWGYDNRTGTYTIQVEKEVELTITLHSQYPSTKPPKYELLAPSLSLEKKKLIDHEFNIIYENEQGSPIIFQWIEKLKELVSQTPTSSNIPHIKEEEFKVQSFSPQRIPQKIEDKLVTHGPIIEDRKSVFQGHACAVTDQVEVRQFLEHLLENKKVAQATHNILAYRIILPNKTLLQDCNDDGESHAGSRILHLLNILNLTNVAVIVSRWYGGTHLGSDRFKHINNAARQVLLQGGFIKQQ